MNTVLCILIGIILAFLIEERRNRKAEPPPLSPEERKKLDTEHAEYWTNIRRRFLE